MELFKIKSIDSKLNILSSLDCIPSFETPLGELKAEIFIDNKNIFDLGILKENISISDKAKLLAFQNDNYLIEILSFGMNDFVIELELPNHYWIIRIKKLSESNQVISLKCNLVSYINNLKSYGDFSQFFFMNNIRNDNNILVICTEDDEYFNDRAKEFDWMPERFYSQEETKLNNIVKITDFEIEIDVPNLLKNEQIQFQFSSCYSEYDETDNEPYNEHPRTYLCEASTIRSYQYMLNLLKEKHNIIID